MADSGDRMPRVNFDKDTHKFDQAHLDYIKKVEKLNMERVLDLKKVRRRNLITGLVLTGGVFGIYLYSMLAVKQETFLDDFDTDTKKNPA